MLRPARLLFRPLELPQRATEFLDGVVRAQIDRLTPWTANDAAFGWSAPANAGADRMVITVAATARALVQPLVEALASRPAPKPSPFTATPPGAAPITVIEPSARAARSTSRACAARWSRCCSAPDCSRASRSAPPSIVGYRLGGKQDELARRIAERRAAIRAGRDGAAGRDAAARARAAQVSKPVERDRARSAVADPARPHLRDRAAHRGRQAARDRHHARRARPDPPDGAVAATSPAPPSSRRPRKRRPIRASASTSRRRSNPSSRSAHEHRNRDNARLP